MPMGRATQNPVEVDYYHIDTPADMTACLEALLSQGYRGTSAVYQEQGGLTVWEMKINGPGLAGEIVVRLGDVLVGTGATLAVMRVEDFKRKYTTEEVTP